MGRGTKQAFRVAVAEDDTLLRDRTLIPGLREYGFEAEGFGSTVELYRGMLASTFDIVLLDLGLPGESGLTAAKHLRELRPDIGIVMLTGIGTREHHLRAMREGADAWLTKPVDMELLAVSLHSLARRLQKPAGTPEQPPTERQGGAAWRLVSDGWCMLAPSGQVMALTEPERSVLMLLDAQRGLAVERDVLIAGLTADVAGFDPHRLEALVHRIRRKAATVAPDAAPLPLLSVRGTGYVLAR